MNSKIKILLNENQFRQIFNENEDYARQIGDLIRSGQMENIAMAYEIGSSGLVDTDGIAYDIYGKAFEILREYQKIKTSHFNKEAILELSKIEDLRLINNNSKKLTLIDFLINLKTLKRLYLGSNLITDITPLSNLTNLTELSIHSNKVTDITPLTNLTNLVDLDLSGNQITNFEPLSNLNKLEILRLYGNKVINVEIFENLKSLIYIVVGKKDISKRDVEKLKILLPSTSIYFS